MKKISRTIRVILQSIFLVAFIFLANVSTTKTMSKVSNNAGNRVINLTTMSLKLQEDINNDLYASKDSYTGDITGYGANCALCSGKLACQPSYYVRDGTTTFTDLNYGTVRIVASSSNLPCGSIVRFNLSKVSDEPVIAIVLDRGVTGNDLDLLMPSEESASEQIGRNTLSYDVLRNGWTR